MALAAIPGTGFWTPFLPGGILVASTRNTSDVILDADEEELQYFFTLTLAGGGTKTFGHERAHNWAGCTGAAITFASGSTLRVGLKESQPDSDGDWTGRTGHRRGCGV